MSQDSPAILLNPEDNVAYVRRTIPAGLAFRVGPYDITAKEVGTQRFSVSRDLHCWQATFSRTFTAGGEAEFYFRLGVKEQREIYIERGTRAGSIGGIN